MAGQSIENPQGTQYLGEVVGAKLYGLSMDEYRQLMADDKKFLAQHPHDVEHSPLHKFTKERTELQDKLGMNDAAFTELMAQQATYAESLKYGNRQISPILNALNASISGGPDANNDTLTFSGNVGHVKPDPHALDNLKDDTFKPENYTVKRGPPRPTGGPGM